MKVLQKQVAKIHQKDIYKKLIFALICNKNICMI